MHFNDLHIEIIRMIFYIHVYEHLESKRTLLRTCRAWYNLASNDPILWKDISLIAWEGKYSLLDRCKTLDDLVRNISRTRNGIFNLTLGLPGTPPDEADCQKFAANMDPKWLSRCRSLTLHTAAYYSLKDIGKIQRTADAILSPKGCHFTALEYLSVGDYLWGGALDGLLQRIGRSSPNLQSLELTSDRTSEAWYIATQVFRHVDILRRIRRLRLGSVTVPVPWVEFTHLEHLDYTCTDVVSFFGAETPDSSNLSELVTPCLTSLCLEGEFGDIELPSHGIFNQITHLVLRDFSSTLADDDGAFPSSFLHLSSLGIQTRWVCQIGTPINAAPGIEELILAADDIGLDEYDIITGNLTPRVLRLDVISLQQSNYIEFGRPIELWSRLEELHLTVRAAVTFSLGPILERALCNKPRGWSPPDLENRRPQLHTLTVLYPYTNEKEPTEATKRIRVEQVRRILVKRCASGLDPLETVKVGWYQLPRMMFLPRRHFTESTVMEWKDCLDDWTPSDHLEDTPEWDVEVLDGDLE